MTTTALLALRRECPQIRRQRISRSGLAAAGFTLAILAAFISVPRTMKCFCESKTDIAKATLRKYLLEAYPQWSAHDRSQLCPPDRAALDEYMNDAKGQDPWGRHYEMTCDPSAAPRDRLLIISFGPDRVSGTDDDLRSDPTE